VESLRTWTDLIALLENGVNGVVQGGDADTQAGFPQAYVQGINVAEFGLNTGNYIGGMRLGGLTYIDDDKNQENVKKVLGALRSWAQQSGLKTILNNTVSASAAGSEVWFFAVEMDFYGDGASAAFIQTASKSDRWYEAVLELGIVCMPSRP
jgi:hypothetical protein